MGRWIRFFIVLAIGLIAGVFYAWRIDPVKYVDSSPDTLRQDYKADYVLMVAEVYQMEGDLDLAVRRLALLGATSPLELVAQATVYALGDAASGPRYQAADVARLQALADALSTYTPVPPTP